MTRTHNDSLVDDVARALTDVEPSVEFRARVMTRLEPRRSMRHRNVLAGFAAVAVAASVLAIVWPRSHRQPAALQEPFASVASPPVVQPPAGAASRTVQKTASRSVVMRRQPSPEELAWLSRALPALESSSAISLDPIQPPPPSIAPINIDAVGPRPLEVAPMDIRQYGGR